MRALGVFTAAPIPGRVLPRLSSEVGPSTAAEVHWLAGRRVIAGVVGPGHRTTVWFSPPHEGAFVREWLAGLGRLDLRPQPAGTPGDRLAQAFARHVADGARQAVLLGTEAPGVDRRLVAEAFAALGEGGADVVLGPTTGGDCYLIGLRNAHPAVVRGIPWGTPAALNQAKSRVGGAGLALRLLRPLREVQTLQDARVLHLLPGASTIDDTLT